MPYWFICYTWKDQEGIHFENDISNEHPISILSRLPEVRLVFFIRITKEIREKYKDIYPYLNNHIHPIKFALYKEVNKNAV